MKIPSKKVEIFLIEGTPFGLRYADIKNRTCRAIVSPRSSFKDLLNRAELGRAGIYFLIRRSTNIALPYVYIGEADVLVERLPQHTGNEDWSEIILFVAQDESLDKAGVRYIESILVQRAKQDKQCVVRNANNPKIKSLSEANIAVMEEFTEDIVFLLSVLGYNVIRSKYRQEEEHLPLLKIERDGLQAQGRQLDEGFIVYEGSHARRHATSGYESDQANLRHSLIQNGVLKDQLDNVRYIFTQDYVFSSPSLAASTVLGVSSNGRKEWRTRDGRTLKEIQNI